MSSPHRRLLLAGGGARAPIVLAVALGVASAALAVVQAGLLALAISGAVEEGMDLASLAVPLAWLAAVLLARAGLAWSSELAARRISGGVKARMRVALMDRALALGPRRAAGEASGELTLLATRGLDALDAYYGRYLPQLGLAVIVPVAVVACLLVIDPVAGLTVALTVPLIPLFMVLIGRMSEAHRARRWRMLALLAHRFADVVEGLPTLRAYGRADAQVGILRAITDRYRVATMATLRVAFLSALTLELLATISVALVALGIGLRLVDGTLTLGTGLFALVLAPEAYLPLRRLGAEFHSSEEGVAAASRAFEIIDDRPAAGGGDTAGEPRGLGLPVPTRLAAIVVRGVSVVQPGRDLLAPWQAGLRAGAGEVVALTGPSGAGKSTLLAVVLGLLAADDGDVVAIGSDGRSVDVRDLDEGAWRSTVAWVPQSPYLFAGTVAANVRLGAPEADDAAVRSALDAVGLGSVPLDTLLGERGAGLSSGQRRRVGVARALVRRASLLLLDEPTAGLDPDAEARVLAALRTEADRGAIVLLVAHRPGAVGGADRSVAIRWREAPEPRGGDQAASAPAGDAVTAPTASDETSAAPAQPAAPAAPRTSDRGR